MKYYGFAGKVLYVDLTSGETRKEPLDPALIKKFIGGWGIGWHLMANNLKPGTPPLSPGNPIVINTGVFNGTPIPLSGKFQLVTKMSNPATQDMNKYTVAAGSSGSKRFAKMLKYSGYDHLVITGRAESPVYLKIIDDDVEICPAGDLWGKKDIYETSDEMSKRYKGCGVIAIGKAGENLVNPSLIITDKRNTLARYGGATNMGYKNLKAVVTKGSKKPKFADRKKVLAMVKEDMAKATKVPDILDMYANTSWGLSKAWKVHYPPECYFDSLVGKYGCSSCPIGCRTVHEVKDGEFAGTIMQTSQFMLAPIYGRRLELTDYRESLKFMDVCNRLGVCFTTAAAMVKFLTRLYERGEIDETKTNGMKLKMGDVHSYITLVEMMAERKGIGNAMADGWFTLSREVGVNAWEDPDGDSITKGTSCLFDGRMTPLDGTRFENVVNPRGGHHLHPNTYLPMQNIEQIAKDYKRHGTPPETMKRAFKETNFDVGKVHMHLEDWEAIEFSLGVCCTLSIFGINNLYNLTEYYNALTGADFTPEEMKKAAERAWNLYKMLNVREGFDRKDDIVPELWRQTVENPIKTRGGEIRMRDYFGNPLSLDDLETLKDDYYEERGWDIEKGVPTPEKIKDLGLEKYFKNE